MKGDRLPTSLPTATLAIDCEDVPASAVRHCRVHELDTKTPQRRDEITPLAARQIAIWDRSAYSARNQRRTLEQFKQGRAPAQPRPDKVVTSRPKKRAPFLTLPSKHL
jgi:hypothetical protein